MRTTLVIWGSISAQLRAATREKVETAGVIRAILLTTPGGDRRLIARAIDWVAAEQYVERTETGLSIRSEGYVHALARAEDGHEIAIWFHTHPGEGACPSPSEHDHIVDAKIADVFRLRASTPFYATLIMALSGDGYTFTGSLQEENAAPISIDDVWDMSDRWSLTRAYDSPLVQILPIFDRNVRAFGGGIQQMLGNLCIGIVGCGGTGSATAEQLVRLGVRSVVLIDPDRLSATNVTRVYGSTPADVGEAKSLILARHLKSISPDLACKPLVGTLIKEQVARELSACDLIFGCTDDNAGRMILSRIATFLACPVIDIGIVLNSTDAGILTGINGRVTVLQPECACLLCRNRIDVRRAAAEFMSDDERRRLEKEGYVPALGAIDPAVVAYTTAVAAAAVAELLERLVGYGPTPRPTEVLLRLHEREISTNIADYRRGHYCDPAANKIGLANASPWLEQVWRG